METTMYGDGNYGGALSRENVAQMKRKFTLDLSCRSSKKAKASSSSQPNFSSLLTSPDLHMLKLGSPELDQLVLQSSLNPNGPGFYFPQPTLANKVPTPSVPTQEEFVKGFQDTLDQFHHKDGDTSVVVSRVSNIPTSSTHSLQYIQLEPATSSKHSTEQQEVPVSSGDDSATMWIKEEPHTVPGSVCGSPPVSPIDMEAQERYKLERKRLRNRIAASKCRKRKLDRISKLEEKVEVIKDENTELLTVINRLRDQVCLLKQEVIDHVNSGCQIPFVTHQL